eukprot:5685824-Pleurochrysis_carterae.AAC.3
MACLRYPSAGMTAQTPPSAFPESARPKPILCRDIHVPRAKQQGAMRISILTALAILTAPDITKCAPRQSAGLSSGGHEYALGSARTPFYHHEAYHACPTNFRPIYRYLQPTYDAKSTLVSRRELSGPFCRDASEPSFVVPVARLPRAVQASTFVFCAPERDSVARVPFPQLRRPGLFTARTHSSHLHRLTGVLQSSALFGIRKNGESAQKYRNNSQAYNDCLQLALKGVPDRLTHESILYFEYCSWHTSMRLAVDNRRAYFATGLGPTTETTSTPYLMQSIHYIYFVAENWHDARRGA